MTNRKIYFSVRVPKPRVAGGRLGHRAISGAARKETSGFRLVDAAVGVVGVDRYG